MISTVLTVAEELHRDRARDRRQTLREAPDVFATASDRAREAAEMLALQALTHLLADPDRIARFLTVTGVPGIDLQVHVRDAGFLGGVLDFVLQDEVLLVEVAERVDCRPAVLASARRRLPGAPVDA